MMVRCDSVDPRMVPMLDMLVATDVVEWDRRSIPTKPRIESGQGI